MERKLNDHTFAHPNDFEGQGGEKTERIRTDTDDNEGPVQSALSNPLVLRQIFICLPLYDLVKFCSLVNKTWNSHARTFVRTHRKYEVNVHSEGAGQVCTACHTLQRLAHSVSRMAVIPINSICYTMATNSVEQDNCRVRSFQNAENILRIKLRSLTISMRDFPFRCASQYFLAQILRENSAHLQTLTFAGISPLLAELLTHWVPQLPRLETLLVCSPRPREDVKYKDLYRRIIQNAPNLKTILPGKTPPYISQHILPDPKYYKLLDRFVLAINSVENERMSLQITEAGPALKILLLAYHRSDWTFYKSICTILEQLLQSSQERLEIIEFVFEDKIEQIFGSFYWPTLTKVEQLSFRALDSSNPLFRAIVRSVDYERIFPALQSVRLRGDGGFEENDMEAEANIETGHRMTRAFTCKTVAKLEVELSMGTVSFSQLKATFPATVHLILTRIEPYNLPSFWQIFRLWPNLEHLELRGRALSWCPNRDAEFCGISSEEMRRYYGENDEFLRAVHIVPIRPCISTLPNLRRLTIVSMLLGRETGAATGISDPQQLFLSKATYLLVVERLPLLRVAIRFEDFLPSGRYRT